MSLKTDDDDDDDGGGDGDGDDDSNAKILWFPFNFFFFYTAQVTEDHNGMASRIVLHCAKFRERRRAFQCGRDTVAWLLNQI